MARGQVHRFIGWLEQSICRESGCDAEILFVQPAEVFGDFYWQHGRNPEHVLLWPLPERGSAQDVINWVRRIHGPSVFEEADGE